MRLFLAFELPEAVKARIGERVARLRDELPAASWVSAERLHLTIAFLGEVDESRLAAIGEALRPVFAAAPRLRLALAGAGTFPPGRAARVAWIAVIEVGARPGSSVDASDRAGRDAGHCATADQGAALNSSALAAIEREIRGALADVLESPLEDRPYHAHVTLARPRRPWGRDAVAAFHDACDDVAGEWDTTRGVLMESRLGQQARYSVRQEYPLDASTGAGHDA